jgi:hypothetical protein
VFRNLIQPAFFAALTFAHRARCAAAILRRADADIVRLIGDPLFVFPPAGFDPCRTFAHLAFCARAIRFRAAADKMRPGPPPLAEVPEPWRPSNP